MVFDARSDGHVPRLRHVHHENVNLPWCFSYTIIWWFTFKKCALLNNVKYHIKVHHFWTSKTMFTIHKYTFQTLPQKRIHKVQRSFTMCFLRIRERIEALKRMSKILMIEDIAWHMNTIINDWLLYSYRSKDKEN